MTTIESMHHLFGAKVIQLPTKNYLGYENTLLEANGLHYEVFYSHDGVVSVPSYEDSDNVPVDVKTQNDCYVENLQIQSLFCHSEPLDEYVQVGIINVDDMAVLMTALENYIIENS